MGVLGAGGYRVNCEEHSCHKDPLGFALRALWYAWMKDL